MIVATNFWREEAPSAGRVDTAVTPLGRENPLRLAEDLATVDLLSGGRLHPGTSVGPPMRYDDVRHALYPDTADVEDFSYARGERLLTAEKTRVQEVRSTRTVSVMTSDGFTPVDFEPPTSLVTDQFRLEPLGPQHNVADHAAWMSSIEHIRSTPGYPDGSWPPSGGMTLEENLSDLRRHAEDFTRGAGFTFTVLDPGDDDVIGCVYLYPSKSEEWEVTVQSWVRADRSSLDVPLADAVARWLAADWPWERVDRCGR